MKFGNLGLRTKMLGQSVLPILLLLGLSIAALHSVSLLLDSVYRVDDSNRMIRGCLEVQQAAVEMQTGMRGFLLTGDEEFLGTYTTGDRTVMNQLAALKSTTASQQQTNLLDEAQRILETWRSGVAEPAIALRRDIGTAKDMNDMAELFRQGKGNEYSDKFRTLLKRFIDKEKATFVIRQKEQARETDPLRLRDAIAAVDFTNMIIEQGLHILVAAEEMQSAQSAYLLSGRNDLLDPYQAAKKRAATLIDQVKEAVSDNEAQVKVLGEVAKILNEWTRAVHEPEIALRRQIAASKTMADMKAYVDKGEDKVYFDKFKQLMDAFKVRQEALMSERKKVADETALDTRRVLVIGTALIIAASLIFSWLLAGALTRPLLEAVGLAEATSKGDLTRKLAVRTNDEVGRLGSALNHMVESLKEQTSRTLEVVNGLSAAASEISATVTHLLATASRTSSAVAETTTTVEELRQAAKVSSEKAKKVSLTARQALEISESGKKATQDTIGRMQLIKEQMESIGETVVRLSDHSRAIEEIIQSVQDIADQSNLLAVNASIEAARAGDQGKGFAVVAQEIKTLAEQSRASTEQVRSILDDTRKWVSAVVMATEQGGKAVDAGVEQSSLAGESIRSLSGSVADSSQAAAVIEASSRQQFTGVEQVSTAMANIEQAMHQNLSGTSELETAVSKLQKLGEALQELVSGYRV